MRKAWLFAPMLMLLLTACGGGGEKDQAAALQQQYAAVSAATLEADVTCSYEGEERTYTLLCAYTPEKSAITVLAPENLTGISATLEGETLTLSYDDVSLDAGSYSAAAISPVAALPKLMEAAAAGYVSQQSVEELEERSCLRLSCDLDGEEGDLYTTWFDQETLLPLYSEISVDGVVVYQVAWSRFEVREPQGGGEAQDGQDAAGDQTAREDGSSAGGETAGEETGTENEADPAA